MVLTDTLSEHSCVLEGSIKYEAWGHMATLPSTCRPNRVDCDEHPLQRIVPLPFHVTLRELLQWSAMLVGVHSCQGRVCSDLLAHDGMLL